MTDQRN